MTDRLWKKCHTASQWEPHICDRHAYNIQYLTFILIISLFIVLHLVIVIFQCIPLLYVFMHRQLEMHIRGSLILLYFSLNVQHSEKIHINLSNPIIWSYFLDDFVVKIIDSQSPQKLLRTVSHLGALMSSQISSAIGHIRNIFTDRWLRGHSFDT